jgi:hypothetical protein
MRSTLTPKVAKVDEAVGIGKSAVQLKPQLRHLDRMPIDRAVRDTGHHVRDAFTSARTMVDRFLATA